MPLLYMDLSQSMLLLYRGYQCHCYMEMSMLLLFGGYQCYCYMGDVNATVIWKDLNATAILGSQSIIATGR